MFFVFIIFCSSLNDFAFAQNTVIPQDDFMNRIDQLDDLLTITVTASLTGLSIAAATFLGRSFGDEEEETKNHMIHAQKDLIKAFGRFLACTIFIFVFDFLEILGGKPSYFVIVLDIIITYGLFGFGIWHLIKSSKEIFNMYGR